jgi:nicotinamidase/pyrazinamidase
MASTKPALLVVDVQNDFLAGGSLEVPRGDLVIPVINRIMPQFDLVIATQDWHPKDHCSFASAYPGKNIGDMVTVDGVPQMLWPDHCVQNTTGAQLSSALNVSRINKIIQKGTNPDIDSYSAFFDNARKGNTGMTEFLKSRGIKSLVVVGLATDYCVFYTVMDARELGFNVVVFDEGCRGVNVKPNDVDNRIRQMEQAGALVLTSTDKEWKKIANRK